MEEKLNLIEQTDLYMNHALAEVEADVSMPIERKTKKIACIKKYFKTIKNMLVMYYCEPNKIIKDCVEVPMPSIYLKE